MRISVHFECESPFTIDANTHNGYSTHNAIAIVPNDKAVHLLSHVSYSNKDPKFLKRDFIDKLEKDKEFEGDNEAKALYESGDYLCPLQIHGVAA